MNKEEALKKIEQGDGDFHVFTEEEHKTFLENLKDTEIFKKQLDGRVKEIYQQIDNDVESVLGKRKAVDQKTYDFVKAELMGLKTLADELNEKNEELTKAISDKSGDETLKLLKSENDALMKKYKQAKEDWEAKYNDLQKNSELMRIQNEFDRSLTGIKFKDPAIIPEDVRNAMIANAKNELAKTAQFVEGKLVFMDEKGEIIRDENLNVLSPKAVLSDKLKSIIDTGQKQKGVDIKDPPVEQGKVNIVIPDTVKTNVDLSEFLSQAGLKRGTEDYMTAYEKYRDKVKIVT